MNKRKILFLTGTRADYGKIKSLIKYVEQNEHFENHIFVTGMHTLKEFGNTQKEVFKDGFQNIFTYINQTPEESMDLVLANTIDGFGKYIRELNPDLIVVHGDRVEALAAAIVGAINNILVAHIEGGEVSGTIDESIRHAISKFAHLHFVSNTDAQNRLIQMGEKQSSIHVIGSPDIDAILYGSKNNLDEIKKHYDINFEKYAIVIFHPVTTELDFLQQHTKNLVEAILESRQNFIVIRPNNDHGSKTILQGYQDFKNSKKIKIFPSIRFEFFIEIMKHADFLLGNSSAGVHEAPTIGLPSINIGTRQQSRFTYKSIIHCDYDKKSILNAITKAKNKTNIQPTRYFGNGKSAENFIHILLEEEIWNTPKQKVFYNLQFKK